MLTVPDFFITAKLNLTTRHPSASIKKEDYYFSDISTSSVLTHKTSNVSHMFFNNNPPNIFIWVLETRFKIIKKKRSCIDILKLILEKNMVTEKICSLLAPISSISFLVVKKYLHDYTDKSSQSDKVCLVLFSSRAIRVGWGSHEVKTK